MANVTLTNKLGMVTLLVPVHANFRKKSELAFGIETVKNMLLELISQYRKTPKAHTLAAGLTACFTVSEHLLREVRRIWYVLTPEVVDLAKSLNTKEILPVECGALMVPTFLTFPYKGTDFTCVFIPRKNFLEYWSVILKETLENAKGDLGTYDEIGKFMEEAERDDLQGAGLIFDGRNFFPFVSNNDLRGAVERSVKTDDTESLLAELLHLINNLSLILKTQGAPITVTEKRSCMHKRTKKTSAKILIEHTVTLAPQKLVYPKDLQGEDTSFSDVREGKVLAETSIVGHIRSQAYGPKHSQRKLIWITEHVGKRWCQPVKIVNVKT